MVVSCSIFGTEVYEFLNTRMVVSHYHTQSTEQLRGPTCFRANAQGPAVLKPVVMLSGPSPGRTFPRSPIIAKAQYRAVSVWLLSLGTMHLRFICVAEFVNNLPLFSAEQTVSNYMDLLQFVYPFTN